MKRLQDENLEKRFLIKELGNLHGYAEPIQTGNDIKNHLLNVNNTYTKRMWFLNKNEKRQMMMSRLFDKHLYSFIKEESFFDTFNMERLRGLNFTFLTDRTIKYLTLWRVIPKKRINTKKQSLYRLTMKKQSIISCTSINYFYNGYQYTKYNYTQNNKNVNNQLYKLGMTDILRLTDYKGTENYFLHLNLTKIKLTGKKSPYKDEFEEYLNSQITPWTTNIWTNMLVKMLKEKTDWIVNETK
jgi:hypothetical protein